MVESATHGEVCTNDSHLRIDVFCVEDVDDGEFGSPRIEPDIDVRLIAIFPIGNQPVIISRTMPHRYFSITSSDRVSVAISIFDGSGSNVIPLLDEEVGRTADDADDIEVELGEHRSIFEILQNLFRARSSQGDLVIVDVRPII